MATIEFANEWKATNSIDIDELGNFYLEAINEDEGFYYYLMVKSTLGTSSIMWYGPIVPDVQLLPPGYSTHLERMQFNDKKMNLWLNKWINDRMKGITAAYLTDQKTFKESYRDLLTYMDSYSDEVY